MRGEQAIGITLPWPPSANSYYRRVGNRTLISRRGRKYRKDVCAQLATIESKRPLTDGRLAVEIDAFPPDRRRRDLDNLQKPVLDAMEHAGVYHDDSQIDLLVTRRRGVVKGGRLQVRVTPLPMRNCPICSGQIQETRNHE
jgi:crossover junction endodeoxyribonuclease RusA